MTSIDDSKPQHVPKILVVCDRSDTAPLWGYILRQQDLAVTVETNSSKAIDSWSGEMPELVVIDVEKQDPLALCKEFRSISLAPLLLFLPAYNESQILSAYAAGVDDVLVKPVSHTIFIPKILAWLRRAWIMPTNGLHLVTAGKYHLSASLRSLLGPSDVQIKLTNLEFRLLHLLMSRPGQVFMPQEIIESIWGGYGDGDHVHLKNVIYRLRKKIELDPGHPGTITTVHGGYAFRG